ncbi:MAG: fructosamine kinase family protein, partial [Rhodocyclaceae bacterium]
MALLSAIAKAIADATGRQFPLRRGKTVGGGCIHRAMTVEANDQRFFVKTNDQSAAPMFAAESEGLQALAATEAIRVPAVVARGESNGEAFLVLEYLDLSGRPNPAAMGRALAAAHRAPAPHFGWPRDNYIGATLQLAGEDDEWPRFFAQRRLMPQLEWARERGCGRRLYEAGQKLANELQAFFATYQPQPSLLHGDLWAGNAAYLPDGTPVIYDPAVYWGDREADIAMTELFGGFGTPFRDAYEHTWRLDSGYGTRKMLYNLYHILNHYNLFGGGYASQAEGMVQRLLAELRS